MSVIVPIELPEKVTAVSLLKRYIEGLEIQLTYPSVGESYKVKYRKDLVVLREMLSREEKLV
jgi:hypothetical protein